MHDTVRTMLTTIQKSDWSANVSKTAQTVVHYNYSSTNTLIVLTFDIICSCIGVSSVERRGERTAVTAATCTMIGERDVRQ